MDKNEMLQGIRHLTCKEHFEAALGDLSSLVHQHELKLSTPRDVEYEIKCYHLRISYALCLLKNYRQFIIFKNGNNAKESDVTHIKKDISLSWEVLEVALVFLKRNPLPDVKQTKLLQAQILSLEGQVLAEKLLFSIASEHCFLAAEMQAPLHVGSAEENIYLSITYALKHKDVFEALRKITASFDLPVRKEFLQSLEIIKVYLLEVQDTQDRQKQESKIVKLCRKLLEVIDLPKSLAQYQFGEPMEKVVEVKDIKEGAPLPGATKEDTSKQAASVVGAEAPFDVASKSTNSMTNVQHLVRRKAGPREMVGGQAPTKQGTNTSKNTSGSHKLTLTEESATVEAQPSISTAAGGGSGFKVGADKKRSHYSDDIPDREEEEDKEGDTTIYARPAGTRLTAPSVPRPVRTRETKPPGEESSTAAPTPARGCRAGETAAPNVAGPSGESESRESSEDSNSPPPKKMRK